MFEYKWVTGQLMGALEWLNIHGKDRWELVQIIFPSGYTEFSAIFKRKIEEKK